MAIERAKNTSTPQLGPAKEQVNSSSNEEAATQPEAAVNASTEVATGKEEGGKKAELPPLDSYNNSLVMPLHEFIEHPIVHDLLHNGGAMQVRQCTRFLRLQYVLSGVHELQVVCSIPHGQHQASMLGFTANHRGRVVPLHQPGLLAAQVLGITNYSHWPEARAVRRCAQRDAYVQRTLTRAAEKRLRGFLHVGLMERLDDSIASMSVSIVNGRHGNQCPLAAPDPSLVRAWRHRI